MSEFVHKRMKRETKFLCNFRTYPPLTYKNPENSSDTKPDMTSCMCTCVKSIWIHTNPHHITTCVNIRNMWTCIRNRNVETEIPINLLKSKCGNVWTFNSLIIQFNFHLRYNNFIDRVTLLNKSITSVISLRYILPFK